MTEDFESVCKGGRKEAGGQRLNGGLVRSLTGTLQIRRIDTFKFVFRS